MCINLRIPVKVELADCDWENKIILALKINDIFLWRTALLDKVDLNIMHRAKTKEGEKISSLKINKGNTSGYYLMASQKVGEKSVRAALPISRGEMRCIDDLFTVFISTVYTEEVSYG